MYLLSMRNAIVFSILPLLAAVPAVISDWFPDHDSAGVLVPKGLTPVYDKPVPAGLPVSYCEPSDTCRIDSALTDSSGAEWLLVNCSSKSGWVRKASMTPAKSREAEAVTAGPARTFDPDTKRRRRILDAHPDWPRRIVRAVREGTVCLDMSVEQLEAAWGPPSQKSRAFILGAGAQELWLYKSGDGSALVVFLVKGRVVGWSE